MQNKTTYFLIGILVLSIIAGVVYYENFYNKELREKQEKAQHLQQVLLGEKEYDEYYDKYVANKEVIGDGG